MAMRKEVGVGVTEAEALDGVDRFTRSIVVVGGVVSVAVEGIDPSEEVGSGVESEIESVSVARIPLILELSETVGVGVGGSVTVWS